MPKTGILQHYRQPGAFAAGSLKAGEIGVNTRDGRLEFSPDGALVQLASPSAGLPAFKLLPDPIFTRDASPWLVAGNETLYWPCLVHARRFQPAAAAEFYLFYSTDHSTGQGGVGVATAPHPRGPWTDRGSVLYRDTVNGSQTETPHVIWNPASSLWHMYYQQKITSADQSTLLATSPDLISWTRVGAVIVKPPNIIGDNHTGYARVYRRGRSWIAHHLMGGGARAHFGVSYSDDGTVWHTDKRSVPARVELTGDNSKRVSTFQTWLFFWSGRQFAAYTESTLSFGNDPGSKSVRLALYDGPHKLTPLSDLIKPGDVSWCQSYAQMPHVAEYQGVLYLVVLTDGGAAAKGAFGLLEAAL